MSDTTEETGTPKGDADGSTDDQRVPYERFQQANAKAKEAAEKAIALEQQLSEFKAQLQEREEAGLPELERERKRAEALEKRIADAETRAEKAERSVQTAKREQWVAAAAAAQNFANPARAARLIDNLDNIEDAEQAERAVKRLAKSDSYLVKPETTPLPGRVLQDGKPVTGKDGEELDPKVGLGQELMEGLFGGARR
jgi:hypothetical protein